MSKRAMRRHHYERLKKARRFHWGREITRPDHLGSIANTPTPCSCLWGCGHRRQVEGPTIQELRFLAEDINEQIEKETRVPVG